MTIFAGAFSLDPDAGLPDDLCQSLRSAVSRDSSASRDEVRSGALFLVKVDIGAFGARALLRDATGSVTAVAGEPLIDDGEGDLTWNREKDVAALHALFERESREGLNRCRGTFCGVHYHGASQALSLFVDRVGVRPLYFWVGPRFVVFATALRILEAVAQVPKEFDVRGVTEIAAFEFALADRTAYLGIKMLRAGEAVRIAAGQVERHAYWRWDGPVRPPASHADALKNTYDAFIAAVRRRQRQSTVAAAFLSGGLDSRVIVGALHATGADVYTVNYAPDGTQDQVFAKQMAEKLGVHYSQLHTNAKNVAQGYRKTAVAKWIKDVFSVANKTERPPLFWSGDGGSVALGHVYVRPPIVEAMRQGARESVTALMKRSVAGRILKPAVRADLVGLPSRGTVEELDGLDCDDPGRRFHLFLMQNDQRRHLAQHFEDIDLERIEFQLPFFDADFLETILRLPCAPFIGHRFYVDWLDQFPNGMASVPWQAYPGHVPCPLPVPENLKLQWDQYYASEMARQMNRDQAARAKKILAGDGFPSHLISRATLRMAMWTTRFSLSNYGYLIKTAAIYHRYWSICQASAGQARPGPKAVQGPEVHDIAA